MVLLHVTKIAWFSNWTVKPWGKVTYDFLFPCWKSIPEERLWSFEFIFWFCHLLPAWLCSTILARNFCCCKKVITSPSGVRSIFKYDVWHRVSLDKCQLASVPDDVQNCSIIPIANFQYSCQISNNDNIFWETIHKT